MCKGWKLIYSCFKILLKEVYLLIIEKGYSINNIDATVALQVPKLRPFIDTMRQTIAGICDLEIDQVSVKATTTEELGFVGEGKGIAAYASVLVYSK